jgi:phage shock protein C
MALPEASRFCSRCGTATGMAPYPMPRLLRPRSGRVVAGVCRAMSEAYGWDPALVRVLAVVLGIVTCPVAEIAYIAAWIVIPEEPLALPAAAGSTPPAAG